MIRHQENDPCATCNYPAHQTCFDCGDALCEECALHMPARPILRLCGDCLDTRETKKQAVQEAA